MFHLSIIGTRNGSDAASISRDMSLHNIRDKFKESKKQRLVLKKGKARIELYLIYTLLQFCDDSLLGYDIKHAKIYRK